jgi:hypothetical protein
MGYFYDLIKTLRQKEATLTHTNTKTNHIHPADDDLDSDKKSSEHMIPLQKQTVDVRNE